jgi:hypothetical protein
VRSAAGLGEEAPSRRGRHHPAHHERPILPIIAEGKRLPYLIWQPELAETEANRGLVPRKPQIATQILRACMDGRGRPFVNMHMYIDARLMKTLCLCKVISVELLACLSEEWKAPDAAGSGKELDYEWWSPRSP